MFNANAGFEKVISFVTLGAFFLAASTYLPDGVAVDRVAGALGLLVDVARAILS